jgi:hypothetical protein
MWCEADKPSQIQGTSGGCGSTGGGYVIVDRYYYCWLCRIYVMGVTRSPVRDISLYLCYDFCDQWHANRSYKHVCDSLSPDPGWDPSPVLLTEQVFDLRLIMFSANSRQSTLSLNTRLSLGPSRLGGYSKRFK